MKITGSRTASLAALTVAAACLSAVAALPAAATPATTRLFTGYGISRQNALGAATSQCILAGYLTSQCTLVSDKPTEPGDDVWVAVVQGSN
jgi:hypothetical protein